MRKIGSRKVSSNVRKRMREWLFSLESERIFYLSIPSSCIHSYPSISRLSGGEEDYPR